VQVGNQISNGRIVTVAGTSCGLQLSDILGNAAPGETLVLEGSGFDVITPANNIVKFTANSGTVNATVLQAGGTQLQVRVPETTVQGNVTVTLGSATSNALTYAPPSSLSPSSVDVVINSATAVGSYQVTISYDKNIVQLSSANVRGGTGAGFTGTPTTVNIDNTAGRVIINHFQTGNAPTGTFTVANLIFTPLATGTSALTLSGVTLTDTVANTLPATAVSLSSATISVGSTASGVGAVQGPVR
jgi:hypothetical protein